MTITDQQEKDLIAAALEGMKNAFTGTNNPYPSLPQQLPQNPIPQPPNSPNSLNSPNTPDSSNLPTLYPNLTWEITKTKTLIFTSGRN